MWLLLRAHCTGNIDDWVTESDYALVELTPSFLTTMQQRQAAFQAANTCSPRLLHLAYWSGEAVFVSADVMSDCPDVQKYFESYLVVPTLPFDPYAVGHKMEFIKGYLSDLDAWWTGTLKQETALITTTSFPLSLLADDTLQLAIHLQASTVRSHAPHGAA